MALPVNITELIHGRVVEWDRLEFKADWNPEEVLHTICAFTNDINNWGGGYIIIGIAEDNGVPVFPPKGLHKNSLNKIQGELIEVCRQIQPNYLPISEPVIFEDRHIFVIWVQAGDVRPYSAPSTQGKGARTQYYIRSGSRSIVAKGETLTRLLSLTAKIPFDDRINQQATLRELNLGLIREFLQETGSDLFAESASIPFPDLCRQMQIAKGPTELLRPVNAGLMFFNNEPHKFFNRARIEVTIHEDESGRSFQSKEFKGPLHKQLRDCLSYLKTEVIRTQIIKSKHKAENDTITNYPFIAIEEALANAVYHKGYEEEKPIEVQVFPDKIEILSYPGPMPPIDQAALQERRIPARDYRNRRIGDFLKELKLTEGKATGIPLIRDSMKANGNPATVFYTDIDRTLFLVTLPCHKEVLGTKPAAMLGAKLNEVEAKKILIKNPDLTGISIVLDYDVNDIKNYVRNYIGTKLGTKLGTKSGTKLGTKTGTKSGTKSATKSATKSKYLHIIDYLETAQNRANILKHIKLTNKTDNYNKYIKPLIDNGIIEMTIPDKPNSPLQQYRLTEKGKKLLK